MVILLMLQHRYRKCMLKAHSLTETRSRTDAINTICITLSMRRMLSTTLQSKSFTLSFRGRGYTHSCCVVSKNYGALNKSPTSRELRPIWVVQKVEAKMFRYTSCVDRKKVTETKVDSMINGTILKTDGFSSLDFWSLQRKGLKCSLFITQGKCLYEHTWRGKVWNLLLYHRDGRINFLSGHFAWPLFDSIFAIVEVIFVVKAS